MCGWGSALVAPNGPLKDGHAGWIEGSTSGLRRRAPRCLKPSNSRSNTYTHLLAAGQGSMSKRPAAALLVCALALALLADAAAQVCGKAKQQVNVSAAGAAGGRERCRPRVPVRCPVTASFRQRRPWVLARLLFPNPSQIRSCPPPPLGPSLLRAAAQRRLNLLGTAGLLGCRHQGARRQGSCWAACCWWAGAALPAHADSQPPCAQQQPSLRRFARLAAPPNRRVTPGCKFRCAPPPRLLPASGSATPPSSSQTAGPAPPPPATPRRSSTARPLAARRG